MSGILKYFAIIFLLTGCNPKSSPRQENASRVRIGVLNGPSAVSIVKMMDDSVLSDGKTISEFIVRGEPNQIKSLMFRNEVDFAFLPSTTAAMLYNMGFDYQAAAIPLWGTMYLVGDDNSVHSINDLKGKTVSQMGRGVSPDIVLRYILTRKNIKPDQDVMIDYSFPSHIELANAVKSSLVKLAVISEPQVSMIIKENPSVRAILDLTAEWKNATHDSIPFAQTVIVVNKTFARNNPVMAGKFLSDYEQNIRWINENPGKAAVLLVKHGILPDSMVGVDCIPRCNMRFESAIKNKDELTKYFNIFYQLNKDILGGKMPDENFFYDE